MVAQTIQVGGETLELSFHDEFDGSALDAWTGFGSGGAWTTSYSPHLEDTRWIAANNEQQYFADPGMAGLPDPFTVAGGMLDIHAHALTEPQMALAGGQEYASGLLTTELTFAALQGFVEIRADIPAQQGLWSAMWMLPADGDWSAEIDIAEILGQSADIVHTNYWDNGTPHEMAIRDTGAGDGFHTYGLHWTETSLTWYLDGIAVRTADFELAEEMYLAIGLAVGGWAQDPDETTDLTDGLTLDYVRVYELDAGRGPGVAENGHRILNGETGATNGDDALHGSRWDDRLKGYRGDDALHGNGGDDFLIGNRGDDLAYGGAGDDRISGGRDNDKLYGGTDNDRVMGGKGDDQVYGNDGNDRLSGHDGADRLIGGTGSDVLDGGSGTDHMWGGAWIEDGTADRFILRSGDGKDFIHDFEVGVDWIDLNGNDAGWAEISSAATDLGWATKIDLATAGGVAGDALYLMGIERDALSAADFGLELV